MKYPGLGASDRGTGQVSLVFRSMHGPFRAGLVRRGCVPVSESTQVHKEILSVGLPRRPAAGEPVRVQALQSGIKATQSH